MMTIERYLDINMHYQPGKNNNQTGKNRREMTVKLCARFNIVDPILIAWLYGVSHRRALEHLNNLANKEGLLICVHTIRAPTGRVYTLSYQGANYARQLLSIPVIFRKTAKPSLQINQNAVIHNLQNAYILMRGIHHYDAEGRHAPMWDGLVSEPEFCRIYASNSIRNVDGLVRESGHNKTICGVEMENSFKTKATRNTILLRYLYSLKQGHYEKVFLVSQSHDILKDIRRFHTQLFDELTTAYNKKTKQPFITTHDADLLQQRIIYRSKFCDELQKLFYP